MTDEQLEKARKFTQYHTEKFGYAKPNVEFKKVQSISMIDLSSKLQGIIEDLSFIGAGEIDVVISNCVVNLSSDKQKVFNEIFRVLKEGMGPNNRNINIFINIFIVLRLSFLLSR
jgi:ubiquinone/menaquinone biosynthesis C-methylase UbiE